MRDDYTPTTDTVRATYVRHHGKCEPCGDEREALVAEFDRWLAAHDEAHHWRALAEKAEAERDELRAVVERVRALADDSVRAAEEGPTVFSGLPFLAALLARDVHAAIDGEGDRDE